MDDVVIDEEAADAFGLELEVLQRDFYYPFGLSMEGAWIAGSTDDPRMDYRYNGKELSQETGLMAYGARYYDPSIGRFTGMDPLAEEYAAISPYAYVANNPLLFIDPDGQRIVLPNESQAKALASDLNKIYQNKYGFDRAFVVNTRTVNVKVKNPEYNRWNPFTWGKEKTITVPQERTYVEANENFNWDKDKYTSAMKEVIDAKSDIAVKFIKDKGSKAAALAYGNKKGFLRNFGGGFTENSRRVLLSDALSTTSTTSDASNLTNWTIGGVALHELLYHIHPLGRTESSSAMRNYYIQRDGRSHGAGDNQNSTINYEPFDN